MANLKHNIKNVITIGVSSSWGQKVASKINRKKCVFLAYHGVCRDTEKNKAWTLVREADFLEQMRLINRRFDCISIDEALVHDYDNSQRPSAVVTFDDGYKNNAEIALPILEELGIPATIYITTSNVIENRLFWPDEIWLMARLRRRNIDLQHIEAGLHSYDFTKKDQYWIKEVSNLLEDVKRINPSQRNRVVQDIISYISGSEKLETKYDTISSDVFAPLGQKQIVKLSKHRLVTLGAHTHCHNLLDQIELNQARMSIEKSKKYLEKLSNKQIHHFAYPNGNFNSDLMQTVLDLGFVSAVSFDRGFYHKGDNRFCINRFGIGYHTSLKEFEAMLTGIFLIKQGLGIKKKNS